VPDWPRKLGKKKLTLAEFDIWERPMPWLEWHMATLNDAYFAKCHARTKKREAIEALLAVKHEVAAKVKQDGQLNL
jgi:hypothetical protein